VDADNPAVRVLHAEQLEACFVVRDRTGQNLADVYLNAGRRQATDSC